MFEPYTSVGSFSIRTYTLVIGLAVLISIAWLIYHTPAHKRGTLFDVCLGGLIGGLLLARLAHVALNWRYFTYNIPEILNWTAGGLDWRGAVVGSVFGIGLVMRLRNPYPEAATKNAAFAQMLDGLTPTLPVFALAGWWGCGSALCAYGAEVHRMADYPPFVTWEAMDAFGIVAPRFQTQAMGMAAALILLGVALIFMRIPRLAGRRFWLILLLLALTMFAFGFLRGDYALHVYGVRLDMVLDVIIALWAGVMVFRAKNLAVPQNIVDR